MGDSLQLPGKASRKKLSLTERGLLWGGIGGCFCGGGLGMSFWNLKEHPHFIALIFFVLIIVFGAFGGMAIGVGLGGLVGYGMERSREPSAPAADPGERPPRTRPNEIRNALLAIFAMLLLGWLLLVLIGPSA